MCVCENSVLHVLTCMPCVEVSVILVLSKLWEVQDSISVLVFTEFIHLK